MMGADALRLVVIDAGAAILRMGVVILVVSAVILVAAGGFVVVHIMIMRHGCRLLFCWQVLIWL